MSKTSNVEFLMTEGNVIIEDVEDFYFAAVFAGPDSVSIKMTRQGVSTAMLGALVMKLKTMVEVEEGVRHQVTLQEMAQRAALSGVAVPEGVKRRIR